MLLAHTVCFPSVYCPYHRSRNLCAACSQECWARCWHHDLRRPRSVWVTAVAASVCADVLGGCSCQATTCSSAHSTSLYCCCTVQVRCTCIATHLLRSYISMNDGRPLHCCAHKRAHSWALPMCAAPCAWYLVLGTTSATNCFHAHQT